MVTNLDVGDHYGITAGSLFMGTKGLPPWMEWDSDQKNPSGNAELPSGYRRITKTHYNLLTNVVTTEDLSVDIAPVTLPADPSCPWRCAIYAPGGAYLIADGLGGVPTIGTPRVRLTRSAPSRAVVQFALGEGGDNILGQFKRWSDGTARPIERGMELTVEYRDAESNSLVPVFRGRIFQIESGEAVTVTAYDRLMDLYQTTGQYLSHAGQEQGVQSTARSESGDTWVYQMGVPLGVITGIDAINRIDINALSELSTNRENTSDIIIHPLPSTGGISPGSGDVISRIQAKVSGQVSGYTRGVPQSGTAILLVTMTATVYVFERQGATFVQRATGTATTAVGSTVPLSPSSRLIRGENNGHVIDVTLNNPVTIGDPANTYIGIKLTAAVTRADYILTISEILWGADRSTSNHTVSGTYYRSTDGASWSEYTESAKTELGVVFTHQGASIDPSLATISGTTVQIAKASIPAGPSGTYLSTEDAGVGILADYYIADKAPLADIVRELIEAAGLLPDMGAADLGMVTFYTVVTTDYLTAIHGLIDTRGYGIRDTLQDSGRISLLPEHTTDETPVLSISTDPTANGEKIILSHQLTAHWASENATVAYIAENALTSGLPLALESDDGLTDGSLIEILQTPLSSVVVDNTLGTHDMMAHRAGGAIKKLHTNVIEGTVALAGYRPGIWDLAGGGIGGLPIELDVPEYRAQGIVIPTEVELGDGATTVKLDNIRTQDRSGVAQSMGLVEGTVANDASLLPKTVYIFGKPDDGRENQLPTDAEIEGIQGTILLRSNNTAIGQTDANYIRMVADGAGYLHLLAVFPADGGTWTSIAPITTAVVAVNMVRGDSHFTSTVTACLDPPKYILDNQNIHVDVRIRNP